jgi:hypothetical protein
MHFLDLNAVTIHNIAADIFKLVGKGFRMNA